MARTTAPRLTWRNWAGNQKAAGVMALSPASTDELLSDISTYASAGRRFKAIGSSHSFTNIARPDDILLDLSRMAGPVSVDRGRAEVSVPAGTTLQALNVLLAAHGLALPNLGDIDAQTVAGAISTGTHGTGAAFGCLSAFVTGLTLVTARGEVIRCSAARHPDVFAAARVGLGALGVITEVTLRCVPAFVLRARERPAPLAEILTGLPELVARHDHFEFFWFPYTERALVKCHDQVPSDDAPLPRWRGWLDDEFLSNTVFAGVCRLGRVAPGAVRTINSISARALTARTYTGSSDRVLCTPRRVRFVEMEYGLPRDALPEAFTALRRIIAELPFKVLFPVEFRFTAADDIWLSHGYRRESVYVAIHQYAGAPYEPYFRAFEAVCTGLRGRPHWGKLHFRDVESLRAAYPRFDDFRAVRDRLDPHRAFANAHTERILGP